MTELVSLLDQHARTVPHKECLRAGNQCWTYAEFADHTVTEEEVSGKFNGKAPAGKVVTSGEDIGTNGR